MNTYSVDFEIPYKFVRRRLCDDTKYHQCVFLCVLGKLLANVRKYKLSIVTILKTKSRYIDWNQYRVKDRVAYEIKHGTTLNHHRE